MSASIPPPSVGLTIGGKYRLIAPLGEGAMGSVYEALGPSGNVVAVKILVRTDHEGSARFEREISLSAKITHPSVVPVLDHGYDEGVSAPYYVMPKLEGGDLASHLARTGALSPEVAGSLLLQASRGVSAAHAAGVVHRDLKPSNLFLEEVEGHLHVFVCDFGLAKESGIEGGLTGSNALLGTPHYMAPEQSVNPREVDGRADVWSLGMVLYHALSGAPAFKQAGAFMAFLVKKTATVPPLQSVAPWIDPRLARVVHAALLRQPDARWPSIDEMALGLEMVLGIDASRAKLPPSALAPIDPARKAIAAPRAEIPQHWEELLRG